MTHFQMKFPDLGEGVVEAELVAWLVSVGDVVTLETPIAEVMTDKSSVELTAPVTGTIADLMVDEGAIVTVGTEIIAIERDTAAPDRDDDVASPTTRLDVTPDVTAPVPSAPSTPAGPSATDAADASAPSRSDAVSTRSIPTDVSQRLERRPSAAPTVRRRAKELGIDLGSIDGSGPGGRILAVDLEHARQTPRHPSGLAASDRRADSSEPLRGLRRTIASRLTTAWSEIPHITYVDDVDVEQVEEFRKSLNDSNADGDVRCTLLTFVARAVVVACHDHPRMNSTFDIAENKLHTHGGIHLGIATQTDAGLVVPVIRDADQMTLTSLTRAIKESSEAARRGDLGRDALSGSTITISSLGALGGLTTTPLLNHPEVAIVGTNKIQVRPVWNGQSFVPRRVMNLSSSFDHRIVDGWDAATFVQRIKTLLENPAMLNLGWAR